MQRIDNKKPQELAEAVVNKMLAQDWFSQWLGIEKEIVAPGHVRLRLRVRREMLNGFAIAHGGIAFALADSALAFAANGYGHVSLTLESSLSYLKPAREGDVMIAETEEISHTKRTAIYLVHIQHEDGTRIGLFKGVLHKTEQAHFPDMQN
ncbi:MAG: hotdog fold thioesterase [Cytophagales bacterium]|nr:MAG: hotdog fold thioesterase [Cytophagales bacterium]TAF60234.1 MAG: hotdog fold thioesterase [Cytophagales bacterium]